MPVEAYSQKKISSWYLFLVTPFPSKWYHIDSIFYPGGRECNRLLVFLLAASF